MRKTWTDAAWDDYLYWQQQDKKTLRKINDLVRDYGCDLDDADGNDDDYYGDRIGTLVAFGGPYAAGIGGGGAEVLGDAPGADAGWITVNGGQVIAWGGDFGAGIGGGAFGAGAYLEVNGGSVFAYGGYDAEDIFPNEDGAICLYLPNGDYEFTVDGWKCIAVVADETASAEVGERVSEEGGDESEEGEGEGEEVTYAEVLGIEVGETVKVTVRAKKDFAYYLVRVTFEGGELVEDSTAGYGYAEDDTLTLEDENPPAGSGFYVVEEFEL